MLSLRLPTRCLGVALFRFASVGRRAEAWLQRGLPSSQQQCPPRRPYRFEARQGVMAKVFIGVDPHKLSATIEVVDEREKVLGDRPVRHRQGRVRGDAEDRVALAGAGLGGRGQQRRRPAVGAAAAGRRRARGRRAGEARRPGRGCSTPGTTARPTPTTRTRSRSVAVRTAGLRVLSYDGELEALRMLGDRREELTRARVQTVNRLHRLLSELVPGQAKKDITTGQAKAILATVRPRDVAGKTRRRLAAEQLAELVAVEKKIKALTRSSRRWCWPAARR